MVHRGQRPPAETRTVLRRDHSKLPQDHQHPAHQDSGGHTEGGPARSVRRQGLLRDDNLAVAEQGQDWPTTRRGRSQGHEDTRTRRRAGVCRGGRRGPARSPRPARYSVTPSPGARSPP